MADYHFEASMSNSGLVFDLSREIFHFENSVEALWLLLDPFGYNIQRGFNGSYTRFTLERMGAYDGEYWGWHVDPRSRAQWFGHSDPQWNQSLFEEPGIGMMSWPRCEVRNYMDEAITRSCYVSRYRSLWNRGLVPIHSPRSLRLRLSWRLDHTFEDPRFIHFRRHQNDLLDGLVRQLDRICSSRQMRPMVQEARRNGRDILWDYIPFAE